MNVVKVLPSTPNSYSSNTDRLTPEQRDMLVSLSDSGEPVILLLVSPERFLDLCQLIVFRFVELKENEQGKIVVQPTLPGMYARGLILGG